MNPEKVEPASPIPTSPQEKTPNNNIKERLNLHVKRRLQETTESAGQIGHVNNAGGGSGGKRDKFGGGATTGGTRGGKRTRGRQSSSVSSVPDDDCSRDGNSSNCIDGLKDKDNSPDILTMILNEKKRSLLKDPDVITFLDNIINILGR